MSRILDKLRAVPAPGVTDTTPKGGVPVDSVASPTARLRDARQSMRDRMGIGSVQWSPDIARVLALPRRPRPDLSVLIETLTARLKRPEGTQKLFPLQAWVLHEAPEVGGCLGNMAVGEGKTLAGMLMPMVMPDCQRAVLFIPPALRAQFAREWEVYGRHWKLPNLVGGTKIVPGRPALKVVAYSELSSPGASDMLRHENPDLLICDEFHNFRHYTSARTKRFLRFLAERDGVRVCGWTGTPLARSLRDAAHLAAVTLGPDSPFPIHAPTVDEWAAALDPGDEPYDPGMLMKFCATGEDVRAGFRRRFVDTKGVVASAENTLGVSLVFYDRRPPPVPKKIADYLRVLRRSPTEGGWKRPDGEELLDQLSVNRCARQLASGFWLKWRYPRNEPREVIDDWFLKRQSWNRELREKLKDALPHLDSPFLCAKAAIRYYNGGCAVCERPAREDHRPGCSHAEVHPIWDAECWPAWAAVQSTVEHETQAVWEDDYLLKDAAEWALKEPGIVWVEFPEFGEQLARLTKLPYYGGGDIAAEKILSEDGSRSIIASIKAHGTGKNLQAFRRNLMAPLTDAALGEQTIGRTHRNGQQADEVEVHFWRHTEELRDGLEKAREKSLFIQETTGSAQRLVYGTFSF